MKGAPAGAPFSFIPNASLATDQAYIFLIFVNLYSQTGKNGRNHQ